MLARLNKFLRTLALLTIAVLACGSGLAGAAQPVLAERIDLIRHGESEDNVDKDKLIARLDGVLAPSKGKVLSGWNSASLTLLGASQAVRAGENLLLQEKNAQAGNVKLRDALWLYSPLLRTRQTLAGVLLGARLTNEPNVKIRPDTRLFERSAGDLTNLTWEEAALRWPEMEKGRQASVFNRVDAAYPNGESLAIVYRRAAAAIDAAMAGERRIIVISHELTIKALVAYLTLGAIDERAFAIAVENAKPITLVRQGERWEVLAQP